MSTTNESVSMVRLENITVVIGDKQMFSDVSGIFLPGRISVVIGKSGAGKTTLLQAVAGLVPLHEGDVFVHETAVSSLSSLLRANMIGYVFQQFHLFPHFTVLENCIDPLLVHGIERQEAKRKALVLLSEFGLQELQNAYPAQLSGGQQQRVAIIRALLLGPAVLLLDEPAASLDPENTAILVALLKELAKSGFIIIVSSQDSYFTRNVADSLVLIENGSIEATYYSLEDAEKDPRIAAFLT
jgi:ABC-type polar amino acid transport system ATPase subunit